MKDKKPSWYTVCIQMHFPLQTLQLSKQMLRKWEDQWSVNHPSCLTHTYKAQAELGLPQRGAASQQTEHEHHHADADGDGGRDRRILVLNERFEVVVAVDHVGADVGQRRSCNLQ